jgi:hypothetical protein
MAKKSDTEPYMLARALWPVKLPAMIAHGTESARKTIDKLVAMLMRLAVGCTLNVLRKKLLTPAISRTDLGFAER